MILIASLNPAVDVESRVDAVQWEEKNVIQAEHRWAGGKGVNVARWLRLLGSPARLLIPLGGATGDEMTRDLRRERIRTQIVPLRDATRANIIVTTAARRQMRFNPLGPVLSDSEWKSVLGKTTKQLRQVSLLVLSGSLPGGVSTKAYAQLIQIARRQGVRTLLDCDGEAFAKGIRARPFLVKPNEHELAQWSGGKLRTERALIQAAETLSRIIEGWVLVSRGANGALLLNTNEHVCLSAPSPRVCVRNTVGAGDAMLAAIAHRIAQGAPPEDWLRHGIAAGAAATQCVHGTLPGRAEVNRLAKQVRAISAAAR